MAQPPMPVPQTAGHTTAGHTNAPAAQTQNTVGSYEGLQYRIDHRDSNTILSVLLQQEFPLQVKPGAMVTMAGTVQVKGNFSKGAFLKAFTGGEMSVSTFTGPGEVVLAPEVWGDIFPLRIEPNGQQWVLGKDAYLAATSGVVLASKAQGLGQSLFSGEGFIVRSVKPGSQGVLFVQSLGAVFERRLAAGEQLIVDNGHLVAWTCSYKAERIKASGFLGSMHTGEGAVCRFTGPGTILIQTRNPEALGQWIRAQLPQTTA